MPRRYVSRRYVLSMTAFLAFMAPALALAYDDTAFAEGAGQSGVAFKQAIALIFHASLLLLAAWTIWGLGREWMDGQLGQRQLLVNSLRMVGLVVFLGFFIR